MENNKTVFKFFTIFEYKQEEEYLTSMHGKGWKLTGITFPGFYHFAKREPEKVTYRLDYNQEGVKNKEEYVQMFSDCGWDYLFDFVGYSYFCKKGDSYQENEEIFCDDSSRLDMMKRVFKGRIIPLIILFMCVILPQLFSNTWGYGGGGKVQDILSITFLIMAVLYLAIFSTMTYWFYQYEKRVLPDKTGIKYKYYGIFFLILLIFISIGILFYFSKRSVYSVSERADGFTIEAEQLNKSVAFEYDLKKGDVIEVSHDYVDTIFISVEKENKGQIFLGNRNSDFTLEIQDDGKYKIECSGRRAKGVVRFDIK